MIPGLIQIKTRIEEAKKVTRQDIFEALKIIDDAGADRETEITELVENVYNADQTAKLVSDLDSYNE